MTTFGINKELFPLFQPYLKDKFNLIPYESIQEVFDEKVKGLIIRSTDKITSLENFKNLEYIYTVTSGRDHIKVDKTQADHIKIRDAKGGNKESVADWVVFAVMFVSLKFEYDFFGNSLGIIGFGNCGEAVKSRFEKLGWNIKVYDPPKEKRDLKFKSDPFEEVLKQNFVTVHVPLTFPRESEYPTYNMLNEKVLSGFRPGQILLNASRGEVVSTTGLKNRFKGEMCIDVFANEPYIDREVLNKSVFATPHIAGRTIEGKIKLANMILKKIYRDFGLKDQKFILLPEPIMVTHREQEPLLASIFSFLKNNFNLLKTFESFKITGDFKKTRKQHKRHEFSFIKPKTHNFKLLSLYEKIAGVFKG